MKRRICKGDTAKCRRNRRKNCTNSGISPGISRNLSFFQDFTAENSVSRRKPAKLLKTFENARFVFENADFFFENREKACFFFENSDFFENQHLYSQGKPIKTLKNRKKLGKVFPNRENRGIIRARSGENVKERAGNAGKSRKSRAEGFGKLHLHADYKEKPPSASKIRGYRRENAQKPAEKAGVHPNAQLRSTKTRRRAETLHFQAGNLAFSKKFSGLRAQVHADFRTFIEKAQLLFENQQFLREKSGKS